MSGLMAVGFLKWVPRWVWLALALGLLALAYLTKVKRDAARRAVEEVKAAQREELIDAIQERDEIRQRIDSIDDIGRSELRARWTRGRAGPG